MMVEQPVLFIRFKYLKIVTGIVLWTQPYFEIKYFILFQTSAGLGVNVNSVLQQVALQMT